MPELNIIPPENLRDGNKAEPLEGGIPDAHSSDLLVDFALISQQGHPADPRATIITQTSAIVHFPTEVLFHIFRLTQGLKCEQDPSVMQGPRSGWMAALRTRKALVLTCKAFAGPATELLYEDIVLRRAGQIPALARTLDPTRTPTAGTLSQLVRSIRIDSCVVWPAFVDVVREDIQSILERCTALGTFSFRCHRNFGEPSWRPDCFQPEWLCRMDTDGNITGFLHPPMLHALRILDIAIPHCDIPVWLGLTAALSSAPKLVRLTLNLGEVLDDNAIPFDKVPTVRLDALEELQVVDVVFPSRSLGHYICHSWELPRLAALTVTDPVTVEGPILWLRKYGTGLKYLHWRDQWITDATILQEASVCCPHLEHLVIVGNTQTPTIQYPALRFLDIWHEDRSISLLDAFRKYDTPSLKVGTPRLERIRVFVQPCLTPWSTRDWPRICHPSAVDGDAHLEWRLSGLPIIQTSWAVFVDQPAGCDPRSPWASSRSPAAPLCGPVTAEEALDGSYSDTASDDYNDNDGGSDFDSDSDSDSDYRVSDDRDSDSDSDLDCSTLIVFEEEQVDRDTLLEMFHNSQTQLILDIELSSDDTN
ncbi:hypothetical protein C8Q73DRAFT_794281 [Cubamyces lactineus]|nr:hypothetical protein C8Q73DRAFT_794281 [Cubamyces lactineus]